MSSSCIRVLADPIQIKQCKDSINRLDQELALTSQVFNLAGNPVRFKILFLLYNEGKMCPCDLSDVLGISVGGVSQHLRKLKDGGLIKDKKVGQTVFYSPLHENLSIIQPLLERMKLSNQKMMMS